MAAVVASLLALLPTLLLLPSSAMAQQDDDSGNFTCVASSNSTADFCAGLAGVLRPSNLMDVPELYPALQDTICHVCHTRANSDFICGLIYNIYQPCSSESPVAQDELCGTACTTLNDACQASKLNSTLISDCAFLPNTGCNSNNGKNVCSPTPWLLRKSGGAPNWVWVFIVGFGGLLLLLLIGVVVLFSLKADTFLDVINPCKWCSWCPGYYDL